MAELVGPYFLKIILFQCPCTVCYDSMYQCIQYTHKNLHLPTEMFNFILGHLTLNFVDVFCFDLII